MNNILVKKENGEVENFNTLKIEKSLKDLGMEKKISKQISEEVFEHIKNCNKKVCDSNEIYKNVLKKLKNQKEKKYFLRYNLPLAILNLGPEGFAFEFFIGQVFKSYNYSPVFIGKKIPGKCIATHEMDIVAQKNNEKTTAELKFHNSRSKKTDLKVALYMKARFDDIEASGFYGKNIAKKMIITNTKFTNNAKKYSKCVGIDVLSWNFPEKNNLHDFIINSGVHPVTALSTISKKAKDFFVKNKIVSCSDVLKNNKKALKENLFIAKKRRELVVSEIEEILSSSK